MAPFPFPLDRLDPGIGMPEEDVFVGEAMVVVRVMLLVLADGGGGSEAETEARQRKHSPLPKYLGAGWGYSER